MIPAKRCFNLVELVLAIGVAAIGITSILGLLPVALHSTSESVGNTLSADAINIILTSIERNLKEDFDVVYEFPEYPTSRVRYNEYDNDDPETSAREIPSDSSNGSFYVDDTNFGNGKLKIYFGPVGGAADFAAEVRIWRDETPSIPSTTQVTTYPANVNKPTLTTPARNGTHNSFVRLFIEISWPLSRPYSLHARSTTDDNGKSAVIYPRNSRIFIREYADPRFSN